MDFNSMLDTASKIKLSGGMVGKVCKVLIIVALAMAVIAWSVKLVWVSVLAICLLFVLCLVILWRVISFAIKNPQAAIMEGAEFLLHEQLMLGTKSNPRLLVTDRESIEAHLVILSPSETKMVLKPDETVPQLDTHTPQGEEPHG